MNNENLEKIISHYKKEPNLNYKQKLTEINSFYLNKTNIFFQCNLDNSFVADNCEPYTNKQMCLE